MKNNNFDAKKYYEQNIDKIDIEEVSKNKENLFKLEDYATNEQSLWRRYNSNQINDIDPSIVAGRREFLQQCMSENLNHARHVEGERLTFNSIYLALVGGCLAIVNSIPAYLGVILLTFLVAAGYISMKLTQRWNNTFDRHMYFAQKCYILIHIELFGKAEPNEKFDLISEEKLDGLNEPSMFSFKIRNGRRTKLKTKKLYNLFYWLIEIIVIGLDLFFIFKMILGI